MQIESHRELPLEFPHELRRAQDVHLILRHYTIAIPVYLYNNTVLLCGYTKV